MDKHILVLDCGATNVRVIAVNASGDIVAKHSVANNTQPSVDNSDFCIWDVDEIWGKFKICADEVFKQVSANSISGVTVTTFGVDGALVKRNGEIVYPVISWQCPRTVPVMENIDKYISAQELYNISGVAPFSFNTIYKFIWLKENKPELIEEADYFLFISSMFLQRLSGEFVTDLTMLGTSSLTDASTGELSDVVLDKIGISKDLFPAVAEAGAKVGSVTKEASDFLGIPANIPVISAGHDTQFAIFGAGASHDTPVLSSGTWEILMVRTPEVNLQPNHLQNGITVELDGVKGLCNPGLMWLGSGVIEWVKNNLYADIKDESDVYSKMISEAMKIPAGSDGIKVDVDFMTCEGAGAGAITGLSIQSTRAHIFRAVLEGLADKLSDSMKCLEELGSFEAKSVICVGGGSRNALWNQIKANKLGIPIKVIKRDETTVLGAALYALSGIGVFESPEAARDSIVYNESFYYPES